MMGQSVKRPHAVIIVENLPLPFDRRVWQEAQALVAAGWAVSAICPQTDKYPEKFVHIEGVDIYRHPLPLEARGKLGFLLEYAAALFWESLLLARIFFKRGFDVVQVCNPPDLLFLVALPYRLLGKHFVFDYHDDCPALYLAKFGNKSLFYHMLMFAEKITFRTASRVVTANESYRDNAIRIGKRAPEHVTSVYSVPSIRHLPRGTAKGEARDGSSVTLGYLGIISDQDGVDQMILAAADLIAADIADIRVVIVGDGTALKSVQALTEELGIGDRVTFAGYLTGAALIEALTSFDLGIIPDPINPYNDQISMNKVFEYSAMGIPSVSYDLAETRKLLGDIGNYAKGATPKDLAQACVPLIKDAALRAERGRAAQALADEKFVWDKEANKYIGVFTDLIAAKPNGKRFLQESAA